MRIKVNPEMMNEMKSRFQKGAEELDRAMSTVDQIASKLEDGFQGDAGDAMIEGLRDVLNARIAKLRDKFEEMGRDIQAALDAMDEADTNSAGGMGM